jgi:ribonuclease III
MGLLAQTITKSIPLTLQCVCVGVALIKHVDGISPRIGDEKILPFILFCQRKNVFGSKENCLPVGLDRHAHHNPLHTAQLLQRHVSREGRPLTKPAQADRTDVGQISHHLSNRPTAHHLLDRETFRHKTFKRDIAVLEKMVPMGCGECKTHGNILFQCWAKYQRGVDSLVMNALQKFLEQIPLIESKLGYTFEDRELLTLAFIHRSFVNENRELVETHNERLEFLGDSVLGLLVAEHLYRTQPQTPEGELSHLRSRLVQASACSQYIDKLGVGEYLLLGRGERMSTGRGRESIHADLFEAIICAIFLDGGLPAARAFLFGKFADLLDELLTEPERNWKAELQDYAQRMYKEPPTYHVLEESGPDHSKQFRIGVSIKGKDLGIGEGASKKEAQQAAAEAALKTLEAS